MYHAKRGKTGFGQIIVPGPNYVAPELSADMLRVL